MNDSAKIPDKDVGAWFAEAVRLHEAGQFLEAHRLYRQVLEADPQHADALYRFGILALQSGNVAPAIDLLRKATGINPAVAAYHVGLAVALGSGGRLLEAAASYDRALALDAAGAFASMDVAIHNSMGVLLTNLGRFPEAERHFGAAIARDPRAAQSYWNLALVHRFEPGEPLLAQMEQQSQRDDVDSAPLHFALGKAYADIGAHEQSFAHLLTGNRLKRQTVRYDEASELAWFDRMQSAFTRDMIEENSGVGDESDIPVFIIGMPRAGTTLVEQLLAMQPKVFAGGELGDFQAVLAQFAARLSAPGAAGGGEVFRELGAAYVARLRALAPDAARITDKLPGNFLHAGLIHLVLPKARIIHVQRDPLDTCLSCFSTQFAAAGHAYSYDLGELGRRYKAYAALMNHWRSVLPRGAMLEVRYEDLVADFEAEARRIIEYCGLDWDPGRLAFHESRRPVQTASAAQIRQPIYRSSVGRSRPYRAMLGPLLEELP